MKICIQSGEGVREIESLDDERILYCGLRQGVKLPYECGIGRCGTCTAVLISGDVQSHWPDAPGYERVRAERNEILMCQSILRTDIQIKTRPAVRAPVELPLPQILEGEIANQKLLNELVVSFDYRLSHPIVFDAGQFVSVSTESVRGYRAYSMTNYSQEPTDCLSFVVKKVAEGGFTDWLFQKDRNGEHLAGFGPLGRAVFSSQTDGDFIAMAGGTGIAGIMAILERASLDGYFEYHKARVIFGLNQIEDVFLLDSLDSYGASHPSLSIMVALVDMSGVNLLKARFPHLEFARGYLHEVGTGWMGDLSDVAVAFLAGPPPAVNASLQMLVRERKFSPRKIRFDKFG